VRTAEVNDQIKTKRGIIGIVEKVYECSVMIKILSNPTDIFYENNVTVINHKNYTIIKKATAV
jgi:uncharacterized protein YkvS